MQPDREAFIAKLIDHIDRKLPENKAKLLPKLVPKYFAYIPLEDIQTRSIADWYGLLLSHWEFIHERRPGITKLRIFNPHFEHDAWQSTHTVIQLCTEDVPFIVDSLNMEINQKGITTHLIINLGGIKVRRNDQFQVQEILPDDAKGADIITEAYVHIEIDRQTDPLILKRLHRNIERILKDVYVVVRDWGAMKEELNHAITEIEESQMPLEQVEKEEGKVFLRWLGNDHFTFLGVRNYEIVGEKEQQALRLIPDSGLGVLRDDSTSKVARFYADLPPEARSRALSPDTIADSGKTNTLSTVHRYDYTDLIRVKRFNEVGEITGERRFIGLYTSNVSNENPLHIPLIRRRVAKVLQLSNLHAHSHAGKRLLHIIETLPREDLFQASVEELYELSMGIFHMQERRGVRLFVRPDPYRRFVSCFVFIPRDNFNTELLNRIQGELEKEFDGKETTFDTYFSGPSLARIHYNIRVNPQDPIEYDVKKIEQHLIEISRSWHDELREAILDHFGEERGNQLLNRYIKAFPAAYREAFSPRSAIYEIERAETLYGGKVSLDMSFYRPLGAAGNTICFKLYRRGQTVPLSDAVPMLENMGLRVIGETPYSLRLLDSENVWINDFNMVYSHKATLSIEKNKKIFQETFKRVWHGQAEDDGFNQLVLGAQLDWREISMLRAYAKYFRQIGFTFSQSYIEETLTLYPEITKLLVKLFRHRFNPKNHSKIVKLVPGIEADILKALDTVSNLDQDRIFRKYLNLINATLRTNYFQVDNRDHPKSYFSFKLDASMIEDLPLPQPKFETFVYSARSEGIHLRAEKTARGGIRWSDRREDFRTEVLGLMKAQQVKNAVIVPGGAKGGFVAKKLPTNGSREMIWEEGIQCYQEFIRGLLDLTDNQDEGNVVSPERTVCYDENDVYLVVAPDKGTATFSDMANEISKEYGFWLGDAFASGGSTGYDHKKMGITARGAWESVKHHFQELSIDINKEDFTVLGIGDMSGDVFGNGMLLSEHIKLVAAFNHEHIFIDPDPDPKESFIERKRLFSLPRSTWEDYDREKLSTGGGVYSRAAKAIRLSPQTRKLLGIRKEIVIPSELIRMLLLMQVDLLWNGGIGTFVKASAESDAEVGDRANDAIRVNADEIKCRVVGEGGNLGFTQLARIDYELSGGKINTDFIDNSGGVDCSDHEVNIKILLNSIVATNDLTEKQRNSLLAKMTEEVAELVLKNNYRQTRALSVAVVQAFDYLPLYIRFINDKVQEGKIDRDVEFLPADKTLLERKSEGKALTRPELAILSAHSKTILKNELLDSDLIQDTYFYKYLFPAFPEILRKRYEKEITKHRLEKEIIATQLSNAVVTDMGIVFVYQMQDETNSNVEEVIKGYVICSEIFDIISFQRYIKILDYHIEAKDQLAIRLEIIQLVRRAVRWFLRNPQNGWSIKEIIEHYGQHVEKLYLSLPKLLVGNDKENYENRVKELVELSVPQANAERIAAAKYMFSTLNIIQTAIEAQIDVEELAVVYFILAEKLELGNFRELMNSYPVDNRWTILARSAYKGDLDWLQRRMTKSIIKLSPKIDDPVKKVDAWIEQHQLAVDRWRDILAQIKSSEVKEFAMLVVALRELINLSDVSLDLSDRKRII